MSDALTLAEIDAQHVELLPARTVLSLFVTSGGGRGGLGLNLINLNLFGDQTNTAGDGFGGAGGTAKAGDGGPFVG